MKEEKNDIEYVYPQGWELNTGISSRSESKGGLTLRDYFAGQALINTLNDYGISFNNIAERSYQIADAMIKERNK